MTTDEILSSKNLILFDLSPLLLERLPRQLAAHMPNDVNCKYISASDDIYYELLNGRGWKNVDGLIIFGHRLPDLVFAIVAQKNGVKVFYVQHGLFKERLERSFFSFLALLRLKGTYYLRSYLCARQGARGALSSRVFFNLLGAAFLSNKRISAILTEANTLVQAAYVYDDEQVLAYRDIFLDRVLEIVPVGVLDSGRIVDSEPARKSAVILCQSLVEDGRLSESDYIKNMSTEIKRLEADSWSVKLFMHQRGDFRLYSRMGVADKVIHSSWVVPSAELYLTDYSSLILEPLAQGRAVSRIKISGHEPMVELNVIPIFPDTLVRPKKDTLSQPFRTIVESVLGSLSVNQH